MLLALLCACETPPTECVVTYAALDGGSIEGESVQTVLYGENATKVTAVADTGYVFVKWSDGVVDAARTDTNVQQDITVTAEFAQKKFTVSYTAGENGHIEGETEQTIIYGGNATAVTAIPNENYRFLRWSDYITEATRSDKEIKRDIKVTALFEKLERTFTYNYNNETDFYAEQNNTVKAVTLNNLTLTSAKLIVPVREHFTFDGWFLDKDFTTRVSNDIGQTVIDEQLFNNASTNFYAKWNNISEPPVYKVLMVFVTELHATLMSNKNSERIDEPTQVDYIMSDIERKICEKIPGKFQDWLNETFNGLVVFEVDSYFTVQELRKEDLILGGDENLYHSYGTQAYKISEVRHLLPEYRTVMTTFCMNDYEGLLNNDGGSATTKYGMIRVESLFSNAFLNDITLESIYETDMIWGHDYWVSTVLPGYVHEFIHTVEHWSFKGEYVNSEIEVGERYHVASAYYKGNNIAFGLDVDRMYLLGNMEIDGKRVGISYHFWEEDVYYDAYLDLFK
jgi:uncharacterized repeat protein (TIGR02543 family)